MGEAKSELGPSVCLQVDSNAATTEGFFDQATCVLVSLVLLVYTTMHRKVAGAFQEYSFRFLMCAVELKLIQLVQLFASQRE